MRGQVLFGEAEAARHVGGAVAPEVAAVVLELGLRLRVAVERLRIARAGRHRPLELAQALLDRQLDLAAGEQVLARACTARSRGGR